MGWSRIENMFWECIWAFLLVASQADGTERTPIGQLLRGIDPAETEAPSPTAG